MKENIDTLVQRMQAEGKSVEELYTALLGQGFQIAEIAQSVARVTGTPITDSSNEKERQRISVVQIVTYVGAILIALGIFSFVAANWNGMFRSMKIITLLLLMSLSYAAGYITEEKQMSKTAGAFYILGALVYGAAIFLIGQIFNVRGNWAEGFIFWMLGVLPMAWLLGRTSLWGIGIIVGLIGAIGYPFGFEMFWRYADPQMFTALPMLLLGIAVPLILGLVLRKKVQDEYPEFF